MRIQWLLSRFRTGSIGKLYWMLLPLVGAGLCVFGMARASLQSNSVDLVAARQLKELAVESLAQLYRQDDASKSLILNPEDPEAGRIKIGAYDRNLAVLASMRKLSGDPELAQLIREMKELDDRQMRDIDTLMLEALGEGRVAEGRKIYFDRYLPARAQYEKLVRDAGTRAEQIALAAAQQMADRNAASLWRIGGALLAGIALVAVTVVLLIRGLRGRLLAATGELQRSSRETAASGERMRQTSQELAADASQTAAQLEEASGSLEEIAAMTRENASHCGTAKDVAQRAASELDRSEQDMQALRQAMNEIKEASQKVAKIVKAMDEIAFHTNILALNAAVEAARAGEAGAGFAVVADEVRRLAKRSAESAQETTILVEDAMAAADRGYAFSVKVDAVLGEVVGQAHAVAETVGRIAAASQEQRIGLDRVTSVMQRIEQFTMANAGRADQGVAGADRLLASSEELTPVVERLRSIVAAPRV